jgi:MHS family proline/betaine transporter-like MFS transporter
VAALIEGTGNDMMPAYYLMATSAIGAVAIYFLKESAQRPLPGSMPSVDTQAEAKELVATQDENPLIDLDDMPFESQDVTDAAAAKVLAGV